MQLTLVSHYGEKPAAFAGLIRDLQARLAQKLGERFQPYSLEQVHGTIIGLEGVRLGNRVRNESFQRLRGEERWMDFAGLLAFIRSAQFPACNVSVGGFLPHETYPFTSQGKQPCLRSFSLQNGTAVAMGWPRYGDAFPTTLDAWRRRCQGFGILHKWHNHPEAVDNDYFFVVGRATSEMPTELHMDVENDIRRWLAFREPFLIPITAQALSFVAYANPQLQPSHSRAFRALDSAVTPELLTSLYDTVDESGALLVTRCNLQ